MDYNCTGTARSLLLPGVDENGGFTTVLETGDIWYYPKGVAHNAQGLDDENEYLLAFDDGIFEKIGKTTFMVDDWIDHTPRDILTKNFGVDRKVFNSVHSNFPYILNGTVSKDLDKAPVGTQRGDDSYVDNTYKHPSEPVPGRLPSRLRNDSTSIRVTLVSLSLLVTPRLALLTPKGGDRCFPRQ
ncbi:putative oxalate decarboxylase [Penicillium chrysogenum]|uniref:Putative oxalate decarboxylase n=1 Tax=Penicillium chrysogenum TaxID=5076 RepID=A0A167URA5_PENCH|nr:uncharacterized protein N7525_006543 [Penicillium rubens]KAJ5828290.1 hypothetical protein N7525_006543 [Penicillium rubens]KZN89543.1 putative oxalate decarboxylase [Penicillium chrysogenum]